MRRPARTGSETFSPYSPGFTLVELMTVLCLISVLMGFGIGFLQRHQSDMDVAKAVLRDQIRFAATTARSRGVPTELVVTQDNSDTGALIQVRTRALRPVGLWHFEEDERFLDDRLRPVLSGTSEHGRFGRALRSDPETKLTLMRVEAAGDVFDLDRGFSFRADVKLSRRVRGVVGRLGRAFELVLDPELVPLLSVTLRQGQTAGQKLEVAGHVPLPLDRWVTLQALHDGTEIALFVDGILQSKLKAVGEPFQQKQDALEVSPGDTPLHGLVDEVQLLAYEDGQKLDLPFGAELRGLGTGIEFSRTGDPASPVQFTLVVNDERIIGKVQPGGVLTWVRP